MFNSLLVMNKPIGVSGLLSNLGHHPFRSSEVPASPTLVLKRGARTGTSAFFNSLRSFPTRPIKSTPALTICSRDEDDVLEDSDIDHDQLDIIHLVYSRLHGECRCHVWEDDDAFYMTCEMPQVNKEDVKITVGKNRLIVKGDDEKNSKYCCRFKLEPMRLKIDEIKAEMKDGLVKVVLPKMKEEKRNDTIHHVKVD